MDLYALMTQEVLERIARHCPRALGTYLQCIYRADEKGMVFFSKADVDIDLSESWTIFKGNVKKLALENLLEWHPIDGGISITLAAPEEEFYE